ncbi:MAG: hypothetical protein U0164_03335 [Gemmatimonadaceae bacterium]
MLSSAVILAAHVPARAAKAQGAEARTPAWSNAVNGARLGVGYVRGGARRAALAPSTVRLERGKMAADFVGAVIKTAVDVNGGSVRPGDVIEYAFSVSNQGDSDANFATFIDTLPVGTTFQAGSLVILTGANSGAKTDASGDDQAQYEAASRRVRFRLGVGATGAKNGTLAPGSSTTFRFRVVVSPLATDGTVISNSGTLTYSDTASGIFEVHQPSRPPGGNPLGEPTNITVGIPDLTIAKSHIGTFLRGQSAQYTLTVSNAGTAPTTAAISLSDVLPAGLTPTAASGTGWSCSVVAQTVSCTHPGPVAGAASLPPVTLSVNVAANAAANLTNTATTAGGGETNTGNNSASDPTVIADPPIDLAIAKSSSPATFTAGSNATYTLDVSNVSSYATLGAITVTDVLPAGLTFVSATGTGWSCAFAAGTLTCSAPGPLAGGASLAGITLTVAVGAGAAPSVANTASVSTTVADANPTNNSSTATNPVLLPTPDLALTKSAVGAFTVGSNAAYTIAVNNVGVGATTGAISVTDVLPAGLTFVSATGTGWSCSHAAGTVSCTTPGPLAAGGSLPPITLTVAVGAGALPSVTNTATVSTPTDGNATNDSGNVTTPVSAAPAPDLSIAKSHGGTFVVGSTGTFTLTVTNAGNLATAATTTVTDVLPSGLTFSSASSGTFTCAHAAGTVTCSRTTPIAIGEVETITLVVNVAAAALPGVTNTATVAVAGDGNNANNSASDPVAVAAPDLTIAKTATSAMTVGANATYSLTVSNVSATATTGTITVTDVLPAGLTFVSATGTGWSCTHAAGTVSCTNGGPLAGGAALPSITLTVAVAAPALPSVSNTATVSTPGDVNAGNNSATVNTAVSPSPVVDLAIAKSHAGTPSVGGTQLFSIQVSNVGTASTTGLITVTDNLPSGLTFVSGTAPGWACSAVGQAVSCTSGSAMAPGASVSIALTVTVGAAAAPSVTNTASVATAGDANAANDTASDPLAVVAPDLTIAKAAGGAFVVGSNATYTLDVSNVGTGSTTGAITVADGIPAGLTFVSASGTGWSCSFAAGTVSCTTPGPVAAGASLPTITLTVTVGSGAQPSVVNTATVTTPNDINPGNNSASVTTPVGAAPVLDLSITKSHSGTFIAGSSGTYALLVRNVGTIPTAGAISVSDNLPAGLSFVSGTGSGWSCSAVGQAVSCTNAGPIAAGATSTITLTVAVAPSAPSSVTNTATVTTPGDANAGNNTASDPTTIASGVDLSISKTSTSPMTVGQNATYLLDVTNVGPGTTTGAITVTDILPAGLTYVSATGAGFACTATGQTVTCTAPGPMTVGQSVGITLTVAVGSAALPTVTNTASVATPGDANPSNNSSSVTTSVASGIDLAISKGASALVTGTNGTFTLDVRNVGTGATTGTITVTDNLANGLTFVSATGSGFSCSAAGQLVTCTRASSLAPGQSVSLILTVAVSATAGTAIANTATVSTPGDSNLPNNTASVGPLTVGTPAPDLAIAKSVSGTIVAGSNATFLITVTNQGQGSTTAPITVTDNLPQGLTYVSASGTGWSCQAAGQVVTCTNPGPFAPGATSQLQLTAHVAPGLTTLANSASVATSGDSNSGNNTAGTGSIAIAPAPDLAMRKTAVGTFSIGQPASYTLTVTNAGAGPTIGTITITDNLPASLQFVSATGSGWSCSASGQLLTCTNPGPIPAGGSSTVTLTVTPTAAAAPSVTNTASVSTPGDTNGTNDTGTATTPVGGTVDLALDKSGPDSVTVGASVAYALAVRNVGSLPTTGAITLVDTLPPGLTAQTASGGGFSCTINGSVVTCSRPNPPLQPGEGATVTVTALVTAAASTPLLNRACVATTPDANSANNCDAVSSGIAGGFDLVLSKDVSGTLELGKQGRFTLDVRNVGVAPATPTITVVDTLPAGLTFLSANSNDWMCAAAGQVVTCLRTTSLAPGATSHIDLNVSVAALAVPSVTNCAVTAAPDESGSRLNNRSCVTVPVVSPGSIELTKRVSKSEVQLGDAVDYTVTVKNTGGRDITDLVVSDTLPAGFRYEAKSARIGNSTIADPAGSPGPVLTFTVGRLPRATSITLSYRVRVGAGARAGVNTNVAVAASAAGGAKSQPGYASTRVLAGLFQERGAIVGKVFTQCNCSSARQDAGEIGIPGVRVYLEDGSSVVTDVEGKYSFYNVSSRLHVVKVDRATLPVGAVLAPLGNRNAGDGYSRFADVKAGELHKADFAESSGNVEVMERILDRRRGGEVNNAGERAVPSNYPAESVLPVAQPTTARDTLRGEARAAYDLAENRGLQGASMYAATPLHPKGASGAQTQAYAPLLGNRTLNDRNSQLPVTALAARERRTTTPAAPGRLEVNVTPDAIPADGQTLVPVYVHILDAAGEPVKGTIAATLESSLGRWLNTSALEVANQGLQVTLQDGRGAFFLTAPGEPGRGELRVTTDFGEMTLPLTFVPSARQLTMTGLLNARVDLRALLSGDNALASDADGFEEAIRDWSIDRNNGKVRAGARGALFLKGRVAGDKLLTLAYDSERDRGRTYFRDIRPDEFYPTYGDGGLREFDGQSRRRFYARLDNGTSYTLFGDFQTARADERRVLSAYDRTLNGAVQHFDGSRGRATLFASQGRGSQVVDEIAGRGISGPYALTRANGLVNSERVEIVVRDRNQPSVILSRTPLTRFADYTIEPLTGRLLLRNPVPSADANLNPVSIRVTYETESAGEKFWVYGGDASLRLTSRLEVGGTYARDENPLQLASMAGINATAKLAAGTYLMGEWARTDVANAVGNASRLELRHQSDRIEGRAYAAHSDADFNNASSTFYGGRTEYGGRFSARLDSATRLVGEALHTEDVVGDASRNGMLLALERQLNRAWRAEFGYRYAKESGIVTPSQSTLAPVDRDVSALRGRLTWTLPQQTRSALFAEYEQDVRDASHRGALGGEYILSNRARLYGRHEWLTGVEGAYAINQGTTQQYTVFGIDADYLKNTRMFSEYRARDAYSGRDAEASIGLRNRWALGPGLIVNTSFERVSPLHAMQPSDALAVTGGVEWTKPSLWKSTARLEFRNADSGDNMLASFGYARKLSRDWTFLGRTLWDVADVLNTQTRGWSQVGFAWRETDRNRWNAVLRYENKLDHNGALATAPQTETMAHILAGLVNLQATDRLTLSGRYAAKSARDEVGLTSTRSTSQLLMGRGIFDLTKRVDAGLIGSLLATDGLSSRQYGLGGELGLIVMKNLRIAGGYNLFGFTDKDLNTFGTTRKGAYLELGFKFDESLFGLGATPAPCEDACRTGGKDE